MSLIDSPYNSNKTLTMLELPECSNNNENILKNNEKISNFGNNINNLCDSQPMVLPTIVDLPKIITNDDNKQSKNNNNNINYEPLSLPNPDLPTQTTHCPISPSLLSHSLQGFKLLDTDTLNLNNNESQSQQIISNNNQIHKTSIVFFYFFFVYITHMSLNIKQQAKDQKKEGCQRWKTMTQLKVIK